MEYFVGIDVAKATLDVALLDGALEPSGEVWSVPNDAAGIPDLVMRLAPLAPTLIVLEATGGYEIPITAALASAGLPVVVTNPRQVRDFAKACGRLAKTDVLDARLLARFAAQVRPTPRPLPSAAAQLLDALVTRRRQLIEMLTAETNRLGVARGPVQRDIRQHSAGLSAGCTTSTRSWRPRSRPVPSGGRRTTCCRACPGWAASSRARCSPNCPSWGSSRGGRLRRLWAWPRSIATVASAAGAAWSGADAPRCARCCT
jgi:transposase